VRAYRSAILAGTLAAGLTGAAAAVLLSSAGFRVPALFLGGAGGNAASTAYKTASAAGQPAVGAASSSGYKLSAGVVPQTALARRSESESLVDPGQTKEIVVEGPGGRITVEIPAGTFGESVTVTVRVVTEFPALTSNTGALKGTVIGIEITNDRGLQPRRPVNLTFSYRDADIAGLREDRLRVALYLASERRWLPLPTTVDAGTNRVTGRVTHFSLFRVVELVPSVTVGSVFVYPNPLRTDLGHTDMNFTNLPEDAEVMIFTIAGDLVRELRADATGRAAWNGRNDAGQDVASGIYLAHLRRGTDRETVKVAVQR
jgi:hypothetical protein